MLKEPATVNSQELTSARPHDMPMSDWDRAPWNRWSFQHVDQVLPTAVVARGKEPASPLPYALQDIDDIAFEFGGARQTISDFLDSQYNDGLLVMHRGAVIAERYQNGMTPGTQHLSQSVAKSVVGTVAGILTERCELDAGALLTDYLPELEATAYRGATVRHVLDMTSGVRFDEDYTAFDSHMAKLDVASGWKPAPDPAWPTTVWDLILTLTEADHEHGASFRYRSIETDVLAFVLQEASGLSLADLVSHEIWAPMGAEHDACFTVDPAGYALADGGFNATLRDFGRFALLHLGAGMVDGRQVIPQRSFDIIRAGAPRDLGVNYKRIFPQGGYRHQFWVEDASRGVYMARGVFGQLIYIDPDANFAAVVLSSWPEFLSAERTRTTLAALRAIRASLIG